MAANALSPRVLDFDVTAEIDRISRWMSDTLSNTLHRRGVVLGLSGGVDSSVCCALAVRALRHRVEVDEVPPVAREAGRGRDGGEGHAIRGAVDRRVHDVGSPEPRRPLRAEAPQDDRHRRGSRDARAEPADEGVHRAGVLRGRVSRARVALALMPEDRHEAIAGVARHGGVRARDGVLEELVARVPVPGGEARPSSRRGNEQDGARRGLRIEVGARER